MNRDAAMPEKPPRRERVWLGWCAILVPLLGTLGILVRTSVNIPLEDDYDAIGEFLERYISLHGMAHRAAWVLTAQHVQYKLMFLQTVVALEYELRGDVNFRFLQLLGDLAIPATLLLLWRFLARSGRPLAQRVWLFALPCYLILSLCYFEAANWAMAGLESLAVVPFALAAIFFFTSRTRYAALWGSIFLVLSIMASANGFFAALAVLFLLLRARRFRALLGVALVTLAMAVLYALHLHAAVNPIPAPAMPMRAAVLAALEFPFVFLGSAAARPLPAAVLGLLLLAGLWLLLDRGWLHAAPGSFGAAIFCVLTGCGVAVTRYSLGYDSGIAGRYRIYCVLLIALEYLAAVDLILPERLTPGSGWRRSVVAGTVMVWMLWAGSNANAYRRLMQRRRVLIAHMILWERYPQRLVVVPDEDPVRHSPMWLYMRRRGQTDLEREVEQGLYVPPVTAGQSLPVNTGSPAMIGVEEFSPAQ